MRAEVNDGRLPLRDNMFHRDQIVCTTLAFTKLAR
jgi:hypothetical protein